MGLDFGKTAQQTMTAVPEEKNEIEVVKEYDIVADRQQMNADLVNSKEVDDLVSTIEVHNLETIVSFGAEARSAWQTVCQRKKPLHIRL